MIVAFFMISTLPLQILDSLSISKIEALNDVLVESLIILTHVKPAVNPMFYASHLKDFRQALLKLLRLRKTNQINEQNRTQINEETPN